MIDTFFVFLASLCWGSFLNAFGYRLIFQEKFSLLTRSQCPHCGHVLAWYDLIPLFSYLLLHGSCRYCAKKISPLYPFIEFVTATVMTLLWVIKTPYFIPYSIYISFLMVNLRTDLESMLLSRYMTLGGIPIAIGFALYGYLPLTAIASLEGAVFGFVLLWGVRLLFKKITKKDGLGEGDADLLALIGAWTGIKGVWISLLIGSVAGSLIGIGLMALKKIERDTPVPFGPFLVLGALVFLFSSATQSLFLHFVW